MRPITNFEEHLKSGVAKRISPDRPRALFLLEESELNHDALQALLEKVPIDDRNANSMVKLAYDVFMGLIRAKMLMDGYQTQGQGAHEAEVSYLRVIGLPEPDVQFADQLRYFRNGMLYYGSVVDKEYAILVISFLVKHYPILKRHVTEAGL